MTAPALYLLAVTFPDREGAETVVRGLVQDGLAACGQVGADLVSFYRWEGALQQGREVGAVLKVPADRLDRCAAELKRRHPYRVPQIVAWAADHVDPDYLAWAQGSGDAD